MVPQPGTHSVARLLISSGCLMGRASQKPSHAKRPRHAQFFHGRLAEARWRWRECRAGFPPKPSLPPYFPPCIHPPMYCSMEMRASWANTSKPTGKRRTIIGWWKIHTVSTNKLRSKDPTKKLRSLDWAVRFPQNVHRSDNTFSTPEIQLPKLRENNYWTPLLYHDPSHPQVVSSRLTRSSSREVRISWYQLLPVYFSRGTLPSPKKG